MGLAPLGGERVLLVQSAEIRGCGRGCGCVHAESDVCGEVLHHEVGHVVAEWGLSSDLLDDFWD